MLKKTTDEKDETTFVNLDEILKIGEMGVKIRFIYGSIFVSSRLQSYGYIDIGHNLMIYEHKSEKSCIFYKLHKETTILINVPFTFMVLILEMQEIINKVVRFSREG